MSDIDPLYEIIERKDFEISRVRQQLTTANERIRVFESLETKRMKDAATVEDWRRIAEMMEYNWRCCSNGFNTRVGELKDQLTAEREVLLAEQALSDKLERALKDTLSHLVAAASLLSRSPKTAAPSNKMFDQMVVDYKAAAKRSRAALAEVAHIRSQEVAAT